MLMLFGYLVISIGLVFGAPETSTIQGYTVTIDNNILMSVKKTSRSWENLDLTLKGLVEIVEDAFPSDLDDLTTLNLSNNKLTMLPSSTFQFLMKLQDLSLSQNQLTNLNFVKYLPTSLQKLLLHSNQIVHLEPNIFSKLSELSVLDLGGNMISSLEEGVFVGLAKLTELDISSNEIKSINCDSFVGLSNKLSTLFIYDNYIEKLEAGTFSDGIPRVNLQLALNRINEIEPGTFHSELQDLNLEENSLTTLNPESFNGLSNLQIINLRSNNIKTIKISAYKVFKKYIGQSLVILGHVSWTDDDGISVVPGSDVTSRTILD